MSAICPECGNPLGREALEGLCAQCLMKVGLGSRARAASSAQKAQAPESEAGFDPPGVQELAPHFPDLEIVELLGRGGLSLLRSHLQQDQYAEALGLFTQDCRLVEQIESPDRLNDFCRWDTGSFWQSAQALGLQPGKVLVDRDSLRFEAQCEKTVWTIHLAQESSQWKIDSINGCDMVQPAPGNGPPLQGNNLNERDLK